MNECTVDSVIFADRIYIFVVLYFKSQGNEKHRTFLLRDLQSSNLENESFIIADLSTSVFHVLAVFKIRLKVQMKCFFYC